MKKILSLTLVFLMLYACIPTVSFGAQVQRAADDVICDFTDDTTIADFGFTKDNSIDGKTLGKWEYSAKKASENFKYFHENSIVTDWREYTGLKFKVYSSLNTTSDMGIILTLGENNNRGYYIAHVSFNQTGWNEISVPFSEFSAKKIPAEITSDYWGSIMGITLYPGNWNDGVGDSNTVLYFESISLTGKTTLIESDNPLIADFEKDSVISGFTTETAGTEIATEESLFGEKSARWDFSAVGEVGSFSYIRDNGLQSDWSCYSYLNIWVYNNEDIGNSFTIACSTTGNYDGYWAYEAQLDWLGWKCLSIPLSGFKAYKGVSSWDTVTGILLHGGSWSTAYSELDKGTCLYLEKIWLSTRADGLVIGDFAKDTDGFSNMTSDTDIAGIYSISAKLSGNSTQKSYETPKDMAGYGYVNVNVYSAVANNATMHILFYSRGITDDNKTPKEREAWYRYMFTVDFAGWKTLSIPISAFEQKYTPNLSAVTHFKIDSADWGGSGETGPLDTTELYFEKIWLTDTAVAQSFGENPSSTVADGTMISAGTSLIRFTYEEELAQRLSDIVSVKKYDISSGAESAETIDGFSVYTDNNTLNIVFPEALTPGSGYIITVSPGLFNKNGVASKVSKEISFTTESCEKAKIVMDTGTKKVYAVATLSDTEPLEAILILAVYEGGELKGIVTDRADDIPSFHRLSASADITNAQTAKAMLWDNMENYTPLATSIE